jgi:NAD(P)H-hydrate repair Nnr-like enzyme with NAD(P)H-hydrate dehydratase domain
MQRYGLANYMKEAEFLARIIKKWTARDAAKYIFTPSESDHKYRFGVLGVFAGSAQNLTAKDGAKGASRDNPISTN